MAIAAVLCSAAIGLAACGQKGPLYLPDPNAPPAKKAPPRQSASPAAVPESAAPR